MAAVRDNTERAREISEKEMCTMIYLKRQPFPYEVISYAVCCGEIQRVRASLFNIIQAARSYAADHGLEDNGYVIQGVAPL